VVTSDSAGPAADPPLLLASGSPRRRELLSALGARFTAIATDAEERDTPTPRAVQDALPAFPLELRDHPTLLAWRKASAVAAESPDAIVLGGDTVVVIDGTVLNKPTDAAHAHAMLAWLSGRTHTVYTGLVVLHGERSWFELVAAQVEFAALGAEQIAAYVATGEPMDKAGAYGLQSKNPIVRAVHGSYTAVVGLPLPATHRLLSAAGVRGLDDPEAAYLRWLQSYGKEAPPCPPTLP
jgi:septum formation protein